MFDTRAKRKLTRIANSMTVGRDKRRYRQLLASFFTIILYHGLKRKISAKVGHFTGKIDVFHYIVRSGGRGCTLNSRGNVVDVGETFSFGGVGLYVTGVPDSFWRARTFADARKFLVFLFPLVAVLF